MTKRRIQSGEKRTDGDRAGDGRFRRGHKLPGPGRPRGRDLRALVDAKAAEAGVDVDNALWLVVRALLARAEAGDVSAAKLLLDRLTDLDPIAVAVALDAPPLGPPIPDAAGLEQWGRDFAAAAAELLAAQEAAHGKAKTTTNGAVDVLESEPVQRPPRAKRARGNPRDSGRA